MRRLSVPVAVVLVCLSVPAAAEVHEKRLPLHDGRLRVADLSAALLDELHLPAWSPPVGGSLDLTGLRGSLYLAALNKSVGAGLSLSLDDDALILRFDPDKLPRTSMQGRRAVRIFTATAAPKATAAQSKLYGLFLPDQLDLGKPLVVLIHGLDCNWSNSTGMAGLLRAAGHQTAYFAYPSDQPIEDSARDLADHLKALHRTHPGLALDLVAHSMGGIVARHYVEGDGYLGHVRHLILIAPPNHGSKWATYRIALEAQEHYRLWQYNPDWQWTWLITDGLGEAGGEIKPESQLLAMLNARPRRDGVKYTIIAGNHHTLARWGADWVDAPARLVPRRAESWWGVRQARGALATWSHSLATARGTSDGPVKVSSAKLAGVDDFVVLDADHAQLYIPADGQPPAAWETIKDRLAR